MKRLFPLFALILIFVGLSAQTCLAQAVLRAGDTVDIRLGGISDPTEIGAFSATQTIDDTGMLNIAYIGKIKVSGMDCASAQHLIESKLMEDKIYTKPTITLSVQINTRFVNVTGEVKSSGRVPYTADLTSLSAIASAGGFNDFADPKRVKLVRDGKVTVLNTTVFSKDPSKDVKVLPGDQIIVPQSRILPF